MEAFAVTLVFATYLLSFGNSSRYAIHARRSRPIWRSGSVGGPRLICCCFIPPRRSHCAGVRRRRVRQPDCFLVVLLIVFLIGLLLYGIALESSARTGEANKEYIVMALSKSEGPAAG